MHKLTFWFIPFICIIPLLFGSCKRSSKTVNVGNNDSLVVDVPATLNSHQTIHVFIENSGSMNGYINTSSDFQMAIGRAIQLMKYKYGENNIKTYYINQKVREQIKPENADVYAFIKKMLEKKDFCTSGTGKPDKGTTSTNLNNIVENVLEYVDANNTVVLISDFIYSLESTNGVTTSLLYDCQNLTMSVFLNKTKELSKESLATNLVQFYSTFDGKYWHWQNPTGKGSVSLNCMRPYYMCILGVEHNINEFNKNICFEELRGYSNKFIISNKDVSNSSYTVFDTKYKKGSYRHQRENPIHNIYNVSKNSRGEFELGIGIDLSNFCMSETDKLDKSNYILDSSSNYEIKSIEVVDTTRFVSPKDKKLVKDFNCTHVIILQAIGFPNDISLSIKRSLPQWIDKSSSIDDRYIAEDEEEQKKTFGLKYFVLGITDAYNYLAKDKNNFTTINIKVSSK